MLTKAGIEHALDVATEDDRLWFLARPERSYRIRPVVPLELPGLDLADDECAWLIVHQLAPGCRTRLIGGRGPGPIDSEQSARHWFEKAARQDGVHQHLRGLRAAAGRLGDVTP